MKIDIYSVYASLSLLTVGVVVLEYNQVHKKPYNLVVCEFGGFSMMQPSLHNVYRCYDTCRTKQHIYSIYVGNGPVPIFLYPTLDSRCSELIHYS